VNRYPIFDGAARGGYVLDDCDGTPQLILIATGSEVHLALEAKAKIDVPTRIVSIPSWEIFEEQTQEYRDSVLPPDVKARLAVEAGSTLGWWRWVGSEGGVVGIDRFGCSAPAKVAFEEYGFTAGKIADRAKSLIG
jgi:transketolase